MDIQGELLFIIKCTEVDVKVRLNETTCYSDMPVRYHDILSKKLKRI